MADNGDEIRRSVDAARESFQRQEEEKQRAAHEAAERDEKRKNRAKELMDEVNTRLRQAAEASDGAMEFGGVLMDGIGRNAYDLYWGSPPPRRGVRISINYFDGIVQWTWIRNGEEGRVETDALDFDIEFVDRLIRALAEQPTWARGNLPSVTGRSR